MVFGIASTNSELPLEAASYRQIRRERIRCGARDNPLDLLFCALKIPGPEKH
jgi:hypothetical protein